MKSSSNIEALQLHLDYAFAKHVDLKKRIIRINEDIEDSTFDLFDAALTELESYNRKPITLRLSSDGGDVYAAFAIIGRMRRAKCKIYVEGYGRIMSAATLIFVAAHRRRISQYCSFMYHEALYAAVGKHSDNKATVAHIEHLEDICAALMAQNSKKSKKFYLEEAKYTDKYWEPSLLLEYGIADEVF